MTICAISQSNYLPWKGYFHLIAKSDVFVFYDTVNFTKRDWRSRNKIMTPHGLQWLTIPVGSNKGKTIQDIDLPIGPWRQNHLETIKINYSKAPFIEDVLAILSPIFEDKTINKLSDFNQKIIKKIANYLEIDTIFHNASEFDIQGERVQRLINICDKVGANTYLTGPAARNYITTEFDNINLELKWMDYGPYPIYEQRSKPFSHQVSIIDTISFLGKSTIDHIFR